MEYEKAEVLSDDQLDSAAGAANTPLPGRVIISGRHLPPDLLISNNGATVGSGNTKSDFGATKG